ncbi:conserved Plasmodium protein, unknown function [Babesia microti strain RI]|uniref:Uncharacterized protein n=1 Tax=Babesia microti (strain RI) TaxID=1133968 RepID=A0A1N6LXB7_BABMR|nr:conserved Plasmodium protein, unknown function [Babesia microti strain RI]SIO73515.1 conserved Plasmodium protein, unknown function [Babesia microti strain RI]|eukprot:XP_012649633.2 conserved Plasmodium protein, unknown function [Babesia microti strain RI]
MDYNAWGNCQLTREQTLGLYATTTVALWVTGKPRSLFLLVNFLFSLAYLFIYLIKFLTYPSSTIFHQLYLEGIHCRHYSSKLDVELSQLKSIITLLPKFLTKNNNRELLNKRKDLITLITDIYNIYSSLYLYTNHGQKSLTRDQTKLYTLLKLTLKGLGNIPCIIKGRGNIRTKVAHIDIYEDINSYTNIQVNNLCKLFKCEEVPYLEPSKNSLLATSGDIKLNFLSMFYYENEAFTKFVTATYKDGYLIFDLDASECDNTDSLKGHIEWVTTVSTIAQEVLAAYFEFSSLTPMHIIMGLVTGQFDMLLGSNKLLKYEAIMRLKCKIERIVTEDSEIDSLFFPSAALIEKINAKSKPIILDGEQPKFFRSVPKFNLPSDRRWLNIISLMFGSDIYAKMYVGSYYKSENIMLLFCPNAVYHENLVLYFETNRFYYKCGYSVWAYNYAGVGESVGITTLKQAKKDACNIVKYIISGLDDGHLYMSGRSIGGSACAVAAATIRDSKIKLAILDRTLGDIQGLAREMYGKWIDVGIAIYPVQGPCPIQCYISVDKMDKLLEFDPHDEIIMLPFSLASNVAEVLVQAFDVYKGKRITELWEPNTRYSNMIAASYSRLLKEMPKEVEFISHGLNACGCSFFDIYTTYYHTPMLYRSALEAFVSIGAIWGSVNPISTGYKFNFDKYRYFQTQLIEYLKEMTTSVGCGDMLPVDRQLVVDMMIFVGTLIKKPQFYIADETIFLDIKSVEPIEREEPMGDSFLFTDSDIAYFTPGFGKPDVWAGRQNKFVEFSEGCEFDIGEISFDKFAAWMRLWWRIQIMCAKKLLKGIVGKSEKPKCNTAANVLCTFFDELLITATGRSYGEGEVKKLDNFVFKEVCDLDSKRGKLMPISCGHNGHHSVRENSMLAIYLSERTKF